MLLASEKFDKLTDDEVLKVALTLEQKCYDRVVTCLKEKQGLSFTINSVRDLGVGFHEAYVAVKCVAKVEGLEEGL